MIRAIVAAVFAAALGFSGTCIAQMLIGAPEAYIETPEVLAPANAIEDLTIGDERTSAEQAATQGGATRTWYVQDRRLQPATQTSDTKGDADE